MLVGVLAGLFCGLLWGLTFIGPRAVLPFNAFDITVYRYALFGAVSLLVIAVVPGARPTGLGLRRTVIGFLLGALCYTGYFVAIAYAVHFGGAAIPPLIVGTMPVVMAILANWNHGTVAWDRLLLPLALILIGVAVVNVEPLFGTAPLSIRSLPLGVLCSTAALGVWVVYGLVNGAVMQEPDAPGSLPWTCLQGVGAFVGSTALLPFTLLADPLSPAWSVPPDAVMAFFVWGAILGIAGSWLASLAWVVASRRLPVALTAQLIVSETVFGLIFGFIYEARWPTVGEATGIALQIAGVTAAIAVFSRTAAAPTASPTAEPDRSGAPTGG